MRSNRFYLIFTLFLIGVTAILAADVQQDELLTLSEKELQEKWNTFSVDEKTFIFKNLFDRVKGEADAFFSAEWGLPVEGFASSKDVSFDGVLLKYRESFISKEYLQGAEHVRFVRDIGFVIDFPGDVSVTVSFGSVDKDGALYSLSGKMVEGLMLDFSRAGEENSFTVFKEPFGLGIKGTGKLSIRMSDASIVELSLGTAFHYERPSRFHASGATATLFDSNGKKQYLIEGDFERIDPAWVLTQFTPTTDFSSGQSTFTIVDSKVSATTSGKSLVVLQKGTRIPSALSEFGGVFAYDDRSFVTAGSFQIDGARTYRSSASDPLAGKQKSIANTPFFNDQFLLLQQRMESAYRQGDVVSRFVLNDPRTNSILGVAFAALESGTELLFGKVDVVGEDHTYRGLLSSSQFLRLFEQDKELVYVDSLEDGIVGILDRSVDIADLTPGTSFITTTHPLTMSFIRKKGKLSLGIDVRQIGSLRALLRDPRRLGILKSDLSIHLGDTSAYFGTADGLQGTFFDSNGNVVSLINTASLHHSKGDDIATLEGIISRDASSPTPHFDVQLLALQKRLSLEVRSFLAQKGEGTLYEQMLSSYSSSKELIESVYRLDDTLVKNALIARLAVSLLQADILPSGFMLSGRGTFFQEDASLDPDQQKALSDTFTHLLAETRAALDGDVSFSRFLKGSSDDEFSLIASSLLGLSSGTPEHFALVKDALTSQFRNEIVYQELSVSEADSTSTLKSYRALLLLEDSFLSDTGRVIRDRSGFSVEKLNAAKSLAYAYSQDKRWSDALVTLDAIEEDYRQYVDAATQFDENSEGYELLTKTLRSAYLRFQKDKGALLNGPFNMMQIDLHSLGPDAKETFQGTVSGHESHYDGAQSPLGRIWAVAGTGGHLTDIYSWAGGFNEIKKLSSTLDQDISTYSQGIYALQTLFNRGVPGETIERWVHGGLDEQEITLFALELLTNDGLATSSPRSEFKRDTSFLEWGDNAFVATEVDKRKVSTGRDTVSIEGRTFAVHPTALATVKDFLEDSRLDAMITYDSSLYGSDIKYLLGTLQLEGMGYKTSEHLDIERSYQAGTFKGRIRELELGTTGKILKFVDEGLSPLAVGIGLATGGFGGTFFSRSTGFIGAGAGVLENIIIDSAAGTLLVKGLEVNPEEHPYLSSLTAIGVGLSTGIPRIVKGTLRHVEAYDSVIRNLDGLDAEQTIQLSKQLLGLQDPQILALLRQQKVDVLVQRGYNTILDSSGKEVFSYLDEDTLHIPAISLKLFDGPGALKSVDDLTLKQMDLLQSILQEVGQTDVLAKLQKGTVKNIKLDRLFHLNRVVIPGGFFVEGGFHPGLKQIYITPSTFSDSLAHEIEHVRFEEFRASVFENTASGKKLSLEKFAEERYLSSFDQFSDLMKENYRSRKEFYVNRDGLSPNEASLQIGVEYFVDVISGVLPRDFIQQIDPSTLRVVDELKVLSQKRLKPYLKGVDVELKRADEVITAYEKGLDAMEANAALVKASGVDVPTVHFDDVSSEFLETYGYKIEIDPETNAKYLVPLRDDASLPEWIDTASRTFGTKTFGAADAPSSVPESVLRGNWDHRIKDYQFKDGWAQYRYNIGKPVQTFKLHISADYTSAEQVASILLPFLESSNTPHKIAESLDSVASLTLDPNQAHKFITIYPDTDEHALSIAKQVDALLSGKNLASPKIKSDSLFGNSGHVQYRYGHHHGGDVVVAGRIYRDNDLRHFPGGVPPGVDDILKKHELANPQLYPKHLDLTPVQDPLSSFAVSSSGQQLVVQQTAFSSITPEVAVGVAAGSVYGISMLGATALAVNSFLESAESSRLSSVHQAVVDQLASGLPYSEVERDILARHASFGETALRQRRESLSRRYAEHVESGVSFSDDSFLVQGYSLSELKLVKERRVGILKDYFSRNKAYSLEVLNKNILDSGRFTQEELDKAQK